MIDFKVKLFFILSIFLFLFGFVFSEATLLNTLELNSNNKHYIFCELKEYNCSNWIKYLDLSDTLRLPEVSGTFYCDNSYYYKRSGEDIFMCDVRVEVGPINITPMVLGNAKNCFYDFLETKDKNEICFNLDFVENIDCSTYSNRLISNLKDYTIKIIDSENIVCFAESSVDYAFVVTLLGLKDKKLISKKNKDSINQKSLKDNGNADELNSNMANVRNHLFYDLDELVAYEQYNRALTYLSVDPNFLKDEDKIASTFGVDFKITKGILINLIRNNSNYLSTTRFKDFYLTHLNDDKRTHVVANLNALKITSLANNFNTWNLEILQRKQVAELETVPEITSSGLPKKLTSDQVQNLIRNKLGYFGSVLFKNPICQNCLYVKYNNNYYKYSENYVMLPLGDTKDLIEIWQDQENADNLIASFLDLTNETMIAQN